MKAIYPGSFDPVTYGHLDIIRRSLSFADELVVAVFENSAKTALLSADDRVWLLGKAVAGLNTDKPVKIIKASGMLVELAKAEQADLIIRSLRNSGEFNYETQMSEINRRMSGIETVFICAAGEYAHISSSAVRELARLGGDINEMVDAATTQLLQSKIRSEG